MATLLPSFAIGLDAFEYVAGQTINGCVRLDVTEPREIRQIYVQLKGRAEVKWSKSHRDSSVDYHEKEVFFEYRKVVFGSEREEVTLTTGLHQFPFSYVLPSDLASSFLTDFGTVCYKVEAFIDKPWAFKEHTRCNITVHGILDLNAPNLHEFVNPITVYVSKDVSGLLRTGKVHARISISRRCVVPGETVLLSAEMRNESNQKIKKIWAILKQYIVYHAQKKKMKESNRLLELKSAELIAPGAVGHRVDLPIVVPQLPPTNLARRCTIISVDYALKFYTDTGLKCSFPVVVGTVPLRSALPVVNSQPNVAWNTQPFAEPPPSYEEANQQGFEERKSNLF